MSTSSPRRTIDVIDRRVGLMFGAFLLLLALGVARAGYLGVFRSGALRQAGQSQQIKRTVVPAVRGELTDRNGQVLALDEPTDVLIVDPYLIVKTYRDPSAKATQLARLLGMTRVDVMSAITKPNTGYVKLAINVPAATATKIMALAINGISDVASEHRSYPRGTEAAQVIGWTGNADNGLDGIEQVFNGELKGSSGVRHTVVDAQGKPISVVTSKPMVAGKNIALTLSAPLQSEVEQVLAGVARRYHPEGATAIVTDPQTDQILALANWPSVNANKVPGNAFTSVDGDVPAAEDQAVDMSYEPGSTFKAVTVAGALEDGVVTPETVIPIPSYLDSYGHKISDADPHGPEDLSVAQILKVSSNIGADLIGQRMGADSFASWVNKFGFGKPTGVALQGEQTGIVLPESQYSGVSMFNLPFGQGEAVTPMQMIQAYDAIADGGILRTPQIVDSVDGKRTAEPAGKRIISKTVATELRDMLRGVLADGGTASGAAIPGYDMAGKTGTAQVAINGKYSKSDWIASFIGMVPASDPKLVVAVVVNRPQGDVYGGSVAAPAFQRIVGWAVPHFGINPCPSPCPTSAMNPATPSSL